MTVTQIVDNLAKDNPELSLGEVIALAVKLKEASVRATEAYAHGGAR